MRTHLGNIWFWRDGLSIRSSNRKTGDQPLEFGLQRRWSLDLHVYEDEAERGGTEVRLSLQFLWFYVNSILWYTRKNTRRWDDSARSWGVYLMDRCNVVLRWGRCYKSFLLPFITTVHVRREIMSVSGRQVAHVVQHGIDDIAVEQRAKDENSITLDYRYETLRGEVQNVRAKVVRERTTRRWKWTPFRKVEHSIWVSFSDEVGPERGSWKGGVTGCGWTMKRGESVVQTLRRMERERRFER